MDIDVLRIDYCNYDKTYGEIGTTGHILDTVKVISIEEIDNLYNIVIHIDCDDEDFNKIIDDLTSYFFSTVVIRTKTDFQRINIFCSVLYEHDIKNKIMKIISLPAEKGYVFETEIIKLKRG